MNGLSDLGPAVAGPVGEGLDLHVETLEGARSDAQPISPHVHPDMLQIILALEGEGEMVIDGAWRPVAAPCLVTVPGGVAHGFDVDAGSRGWAVTMAHHRVLDAALNRNAGVGRLLRQPHVARMEPEGEPLRILAGLMAELAAEYARAQEGRAACLDALCLLLLVHASRAIRQDPDLHTGDSGAERELFLAFRTLVERRFLTDRSVAGYLKALRCSHVRLNRVCRLFAGCGAKEIILERLADEAKRRLVFSAASAAQIGYSLGFVEPSYFVRFFRKQVGLTPGQFRQASNGRHRAPA